MTTLPPTRTLSVRAETFPIRGAFTISRETRTEAQVVVAEVSDGTHTGRGECVPYKRYKESVEGVTLELEAMAPAVQDGMTSEQLQFAMKAGAARCALDCALLDFEAKAGGTRVAERFGIDVRPLTTAYTISLGEPAQMAEAAASSGHALLKIKLGAGASDVDRIAAIRAAVPDATLIVDANEGWADANLLINLSACADAGVALVEQPLPSARDGLLATISHPVPICADESAHTSDGLSNLAGRYDAVNVKLNKAGGLTESLAMIEAARNADLKVMVGCMLGTSLAMAPAVLAAQNVDYVDLDGPLLLAKDRSPALDYEGNTIHPPSPELWG
ncbi:MAG: N-acetyl-D-Glu racemase DgcA [Pseudomonadota bacterium]